MLKIGSQGESVSGGSAYRIRLNGRWGCLRTARSAEKMVRGVCRRDAVLVLGKNERIRLPGSRVVNRGIKKDPNIRRSLGGVNKDSKKKVSTCARTGQGGSAIKKRSRAVTAYHARKGRCQPMRTRARTSKENGAGGRSTQSADTRLAFNEKRDNAE